MQPESEALEATKCSGMSGDNAFRCSIDLQNQQR
jgi:hypothetical protein